MKGCWTSLTCCFFAIACLGFAAPLASAEEVGTLDVGTNAEIEMARAAAERVVKIYGAGIGAVEPYGSGILVTADGYVLTVLSPMLSTNQLRVVLADGRRREAKVVASDPEKELALLHIEASDLPCFDWQRAASEPVGRPGDIIYAVANPYEIAAGDEMVSVQRGVIMGLAPLAASDDRLSPVERTRTWGEIYFIDAITNNPGAAGGALVDAHGNLLGLLGKEYIDNRTRTWVHTAQPASLFAEFVRAGIEGKAQPAVATLPAVKPKEELSFERLDHFGVRLLPDVLDRTPAYIDRVVVGSDAAKAGLRPDDLIVYVDKQLVQSVREVRDELARSEQEDAVELMILRGEEMFPITLSAADPKRPSATKNASKPKSSSTSDRLRALLLEPEDEPETPDKLDGNTEDSKDLKATKGTP